MVFKFLSEEDFDPMGTHWQPLFDRASSVELYAYDGFAAQFGYVGLGTRLCVSTVNFTGKVLYLDFCQITCDKIVETIRSFPNSFCPIACTFFCHDPQIGGVEFSIDDFKRVIFALNNSRIAWQVILASCPSMCLQDVVDLCPERYAVDIVCGFTDGLFHDFQISHQFWW